VALLYGPSELRTSVDGVPVRIRQATAYPAETTVAFTVETPGTVEFSLLVRIPGWAQGVALTGIAEGRAQEAPSALRLAGPWSGRTTFELRLGAPVEVRASDAGQRLVARGPLLYALPLPGERQVTRRYDTGGTGTRFEDVLVLPKGSQAEPRLRGAIGVAGVPSGCEAARAAHLWQRQGVQVALADPAGRDEAADLVPLGATALRIVAFQPA
jgi:hypothetical protein